jgi:[protein-PII] uridylyltransferase
MARLRDAVEQARFRMGQALIARPEGRAVCAALSDAYDDLVADLWRKALVELDMSGQGQHGQHGQLALVATGGWGRREMCPRSDIDFIVLTPDPEGSAPRAVAEALLYPLWDAGIRVGHAVRAPGDAAVLARDDLATATALLDARLITGDPRLADELYRACRRTIAPGGNANAFVARLAEEKARRHDRFGDSLYLLEPNLKHGIGALRDLATAIWAAKARWAVSELGELVMMGQASRRQVVIMEQALDFLLALRCLAQLKAGRAMDQLTFEIQEAIAPELYPDARLPEGELRPAVAPAVEALMRRFYLHARGVVQVTDRLLEMARVPARRKPRIGRIDSVFLTFNGKLAVSDPVILRQRPAEMYRLFRVALDHDVPIYGHTKELIAELVAGNLAAITADPACSRHFLDALCDIRDSGQPSLLEQMHQLGLLGAVMPEFAPCTCRVQHDLYHVYTVDQHQLYAVAMLKRLARGELADEYPIATLAMAGIDSPRSLYLGTLLHDVGKPLGKGHAEQGARITRVMAERLGMDPREVEVAEFLVRQHLTMSHLSQRRDLSDPEVIGRFAARVGDEQRLAKLYLCTLCDTAMTAPGNLSAWKNELLSELYLRTRDHLEGGTTAALRRVADLATAARKRLAEILTRPGEPEASPDALADASPEALADASLDREQVDEFLASIDERFFTLLSPRQLARLARLAWAHERSPAPAAIAVTCYPLKGHSELCVVADDARGLLAAIAGALAANRIDVLGAVIGPRRAQVPDAPQVALDLFFVRDLYGRAIPAEDPRWERLRSDLNQLLAGRAASGVERAAIEELMSRRRKSGLSPRVTPGVATRIEIHNDASSEATVIEISTRDAVGVLYAITRTLTDLGLDIHLSKVATQGEEVADVFYVTRGEGRKKITDAHDQARLKERLASALAEASRA